MPNQDDDLILTAEVIEASFVLVTIETNDHGHRSESGGILKLAHGGREPKTSSS